MDTKSPRSIRDTVEKRSDLVVVIFYCQGKETDVFFFFLVWTFRSFRLGINDAIEFLNQFENILFLSKSKRSPRQCSPFHEDWETSVENKNQKAKITREQVILDGHWQTRKEKDVHKSRPSTSSAQCPCLECLLTAVFAGIYLQQFERRRIQCFFLKDNPQASSRAEESSKCL